MKSEFKIQVTTGSMFQFLMYHTYHGFSGIFGTVLGVALIAYFVSPLSEGNMNRWMYLVFGAIFLVYQPWSLYTRAAKQTKLNPVFKQPLTYTVAEEGLQVIQGEAANEIAWNNVYKVRETAQNIYVYTNSRNAFIWVKSQMGTEEAAVKKMLTDHVPAATRKLKG